MLPITVETNLQARIVRPTAEELAALIRRIGSEDDRFLVLRHAPDLPDVFIQVLHGNDGDYTLEHRDGPSGQLFQVRLSSPEPVVTTLTAWAAGTPGWDSALEWRPLDGFGPSDPPPPLELPETEREELEEQVRLSIAAGYATRDQLTELAEDYLVSGDSHPVSRAQAAALVDRLWLERVREQEQWRGKTDPERLAEAFTNLEESGIVAREDFACCRNCGLGEIGAEASPGTTGFVFFHYQCTEHAAAGRGLSLYYGGFDSSEDTTIAVGHQVVAALAEAGLSTRWNGSPDAAIEVTPLDWRKRLTG